MKFSCDQCKTKYSIADERVRGKILKIRCKHCQHIMTVREQALPPAKEKGVLERALDQALSTSPSSALHKGSDATIVSTPALLLGLGAPAEVEEWHISVDGVARGPMRLDALCQQLVLERAVGDQELYVWRDGFDDWKPPGEVPEVRGMVEKLRPGLPAGFWGRAPLSPSGLAAAAERREPLRSTHPVERVESFEFTDTPPTVSVPRKAVHQAVFKDALHESAGPAAPEQAPSREVEPKVSLAITRALASLEEKGEETERGNVAASDDRGGVDLHISEASQLIDLSQMAAALRPSASSSPPPAEDVVAPPAPVLALQGPAPAAPRYLKLVLSLAVATCLLLIATVAYLLLHRDPPGRPVAEGKDAGKMVTDRPVAVKDDAPVGASARDEPSEGHGRREGGPRRHVKLPASAAGRGQLDGNAATLAKLYGEGANSEPSLPPPARPEGSQGGGVSTIELKEVMRRNQKSLSACYERALKHDETLRRARIDVHVKVGLSGMVQSVSIGQPFASTDLGGCVQQTIRRWHFPASDSEYETRFPLILTAD